VAVVVELELHKLVELQQVVVDLEETDQTELEITQQVQVLVVAVELEPEVMHQQVEMVVEVW
tara:strand:- start:29 stop:214 length:186 start_codon:yes stop_codon:yes gene_type:complete